MEPRILVFGCGGIGGYVSGMLTKGGADVTVVDMWPEHVSRMQQTGLEVKCAYNAETFSVPVKALHLYQLQEEQEAFDFAFICVKSYDTKWAAMCCRNYLKKDGAFVSFQNGINEYALAETVGAENCLGVAILIAAACFEPGHVERYDTRESPFHFGEQTGPATPVSLFAMIVYGHDRWQESGFDRLACVSGAARRAVGVAVRARRRRRGGDD